MRYAAHRHRADAQQRDIDALRFHAAGFSPTVRTARPTGVR
ncbi:MAG: hypothetical protein R3D05_01740 [Dongiaceae bacterium]